MMTANTEKRTIAFIRTIAERCSSCLHRHPEKCRNCISSWANEIMADYEEEVKRNMLTPKPQRDLSFYARQMKIIDILSTEKRPMYSYEIDLKDFCTPQLKYWTIRKMVKRGMLKAIRRDGDCHYVYDVRKKRNNHEA